jgi:HEAT repeat protein
MLRATFGRLISVAALAFLGCGPHLPDDLTSLIRLMNEKDETLSVDSTNKVWKAYGKSGLIRAVDEGGAIARARAAFQLREYKDRDTETRMVRLISTDPDSFVRLQALWTLEEIGTPEVLPTVRRMVNDSDATISRQSQDTVRAIERRAAETSK